MKKIIAFAFALVSLVSIADTWSSNPWVHTPNENRVISDVVRWAVIDSRGNTAEILYDNGVVNVDSLAKATESLKLSVNSIFNTMAYLASDIILMNDDLVRIDKSLEDLDGKLDSAFGEIIEKLKEIELKDEESGVSKTLERKGTSNERTTYTAHNIFNVAAAQADGKSIVSNAQDKLEIKGYTTMKSVVGVQPFNRGESFGLFWDNPWLTDDEKSIVVDVDEYFRPSKTSGKHGIHIKGWYSQSPCGENLSKMLTDPNDLVNRDAHKILCRVNSGDNAVLHYLPIGNVIKAGGGCAFRFHSSTDNPGDDIIVGEASTTNTINFAKMSDSNVKVNISGNSGKNGDVTIKIGVYYK